MKRMAASVLRTHRRACTAGCARPSLSLGQVGFIREIASSAVPAGLAVIMAVRLCARPLTTQALARGRMEEREWEVKRRHKWRGIRLYCYQNELSKAFSADAGGVSGPSVAVVSYGGPAHSCGPEARGNMYS